MNDKQGNSNVQNTQQNNQQSQQNEENKQNTKIENKGKLYINLVKIPIHNFRFHPQQSTLIFLLT